MWWLLARDVRRRAVGGRATGEQTLHDSDIGVITINTTTAAAPPFSSACARFTPLCPCPCFPTIARLMTDCLNLSAVTFAVCMEQLFSRAVL
jgi:hypothetical protein